MATQKFQCPKCRAVLKVHGYGPRQISCPRCTTLLEIDLGEAPPAIPPVQRRDDLPEDPPPPPLPPVQRRPDPPPVQKLAPPPPVPSESPTSDFEFFDGEPEPPVDFDFRAEPLSSEVLDDHDQLPVNKRPDPDSDDQAVRPARADNRRRIIGMSLLGLFGLATVVAVISVVIVLKR